MKDIVICLLLYLLIDVTPGQGDSIIASSSRSSSVIPTLTSSINVVPTPSIVPTDPPTQEQPCDSVPCKNGAECANLLTGGFECTCAQGWSGSTCKEETVSYELDTEVEYVLIGQTKVFADHSGHYKELLADVTSPAFDQACQNFKDSMLQVFDAASQKVKAIVCQRIYFASLHVDYVVEWGKKENITSPEQVAQIIEKGIVELEKTAPVRSNVIKANTSVVKDFDECAAKQGYCHGTATCTNFVGGYTCSCPDAFVMMADGSCARKKTETSNVLVIVLPAVLGGLFLLVILICVIAAVRKQKNHYFVQGYQLPRKTSTGEQKEREEPSSSSDTGFEYSMEGR